MKIVSWNVNSIKARLDHVQRYLKEEAPDVLMIQELKGLDFPTDAFTPLGYQTHALTQKAYNGVAVFSKSAITPIQEGLPGDDTDEQARYLEFEIETPRSPLRLINIYLPNGNPVDTEKFTYKLNWMERLYKRLKILRQQNITFAIGGDFNVIPEDKDCYDPQSWEGDALAHPKSRAAFRKLLHLGLLDAFRALNNAPGHYTFWDYQKGAWPKDNGIRIDHFLLSPEIADRLQSCSIDKTPRGLDKPSDHTPILIEFES